jgi:molecular chaperone DnaJ
MEFKDYYKILGVEQSASPSEIKKKYRTLAKKYHPDANPDNKAAEEKFKAISEAYDILSDTSKKEQYDQMLKYGPGSGSFNPNDLSSIFGQFGGGGQASQFSDLFDLFGGGGGGGFGGHSSPRQRRRSRGEDIEVTTTISFEQSLKGGNLKLGIPQQEICTHCKGTGTYGGQNTGTTCSFCRGSGNIRIKKPLTVIIPKGADNEHVIKVAGEGNLGKNGGPNGNLIVKLKVKEHSDFKREGLNLHTAVSISFIEAILGTKKKVATPFESVMVTIPAGTQPGGKLKLKNMGVSTATNKGDLIVEIKVSIPKKITDEIRKQLLHLEKELLD